MFCNQFIVLLDRDNPDVEVVGFTHSQIPHIETHTYPASLAGRYYPQGIPISNEEKLEELIKEHNVDTCIMAYSDLPYDSV
eukprot:jgi/Chrzof1/10165/Cz04g31110.t1